MRETYPKGTGQSGLLKVDPPLHCGRVLVPFFDLISQAGDFSIFQVAADQYCFSASARPRYPDQRLPSHSVRHYEETPAGIDIGQDGVGWVPFPMGDAFPRGD